MVRRKRKTIVALTLSEVLVNPEQREKFIIEEERMDLSNIIHRNRVKNQTLFDILFIHNQINRSQHEAIFMFVEELGKSGGSIASPNLESLNHEPAYKVSNHMAQRRMAFSSAYRAMLKDSGEIPAGIVMRAVDNMYSFPYRLMEQGVYAKKLGKVISKPLQALVKNYGVEGKVDPRDLLRIQAGSTRQVDVPVNRRRYSVIQ